MVKINLLNSENALQYPNEELIPYACYIDKYIILTKNADLLVTFKIPSFVTNKSQIDLYEIRENLRLIMSNLFKRQNISLYFNTVRKKIDIISSGEDKNYFAKNVTEAWNEQNNWYNQFVNELYITVIISTDITTNVFNPLFFLRSLTQTGVNHLYSKKIVACANILKKLASQVMDKMAEYDIKLLSIKENSNGVLYSEHMELFSLFINLEEMNFPLIYDNISNIIRQKRMAYGTDTIEVDRNGEKKFCSVYSVKTFQDLTLSQLDKLIQLPMEMVVTETASFIDNKFVFSKYSNQEEISLVSGDTDLSYFSGLSELISNNTGKDTDYCIGQATVMVINSLKTGLINDCKKLYKALDDIGLIAIKENVYLPTIFWSQLPGNFRYLKRLHVIPSTKIGGYVSLFNFPTGKIKSNYWGDAITIMPTALNTPYFFNFHSQNNGNTLIVGIKNTGKTTIMNFLLSQTSKICPRIFYIDTMRSSEVFINAMGGKYYRISPKINEKDQFKINPFLLENTTENEKFLNDFIISLVYFQDNGFIEMGQNETRLASQYKNIPNIVKQILAMNMNERTFENVAQLFDKAETKLIYSKLIPWYKKENISFIFNNKENTKFNDKIIGISLKSIIENEHLTTPVFNCILDMFSKIIDGQPTILAIDDAWSIINNDIIAPKFFKILAELPNKNVMTIITTDGHDKSPNNAIDKPINNFFATELYLVNPNTTPYQKKVFSIQDEESKMLALMRLESRNFLLKCIDDVVISSINLKNFSFYKNIFSDDNISINAMNKAKDVGKSNDPSVWIPLFMKIMEEYEKSIKQKRLKDDEQNQLMQKQSKNNNNTKL
jgi:type IV secretion system protein VirB4